MNSPFDNLPDIDFSEIDEEERRQTEEAFKEIDPYAARVLSPVLVHVAHALDEVITPEWFGAFRERRELGLAVDIIVGAVVSKNEFSAKYLAVAVATLYYVGWMDGEKKKAGEKGHTVEDRGRED